MKKLGSGLIIAIGILGLLAALVAENSRRVSGATVCYPYQGCLGTSTTPGLGSIPIGFTSTEYGLLASSTDGFQLTASSGAPLGVAWEAAGGTAFSTSSAYSWSSLQTFNGGVTGTSTLNWGGNLNVTGTSNFVGAVTLPTLTSLRVSSATINNLVDGQGTKFSTSSGANPTASIGLTAVNGTANTFLRSDGASALDVGIAPTWTGLHIFNNTSTFNAQVNLGSSTASRLLVTDANKNIVSSGSGNQSCSGTDKVSSLSATGTITCTADTGGGGGASSTFSYAFTPGAAVMASSSNPALNRNEGANWIDTTLDFSDTAQETIYYELLMPEFIPSTGVASATYAVVWRTTDASSSQTVMWQFTSRCAGNDAVWDAITTPPSAVATTSDTWIASGDIHLAPPVNASSGMFNSNQLCQFKLDRDVANDTIGRDVKLIRWVLKLLW